MARQRQRHPQATTSMGRAREWLAHWLARHTLHARTALIAAVLALVTLAFAAVLAAQSSSPTPPSGWVSLASSAPQDVLAAARQTPAFQSVASGARAPLSQALARGKLGAPVLVRAYHPTDGMTDVYVVPLYDTPNDTASEIDPVALLDFAYDSAHQQLHALAFAGPFMPGDVLYHQPFPRLTIDQARASLAHERGVQLAAGTAPTLIYFAADMNRIAGPDADLKWTGGGQFADYAVWHTQGADGHEYIVGIDGHVYTPDQLPLAT